MPARHPYKRIRNNKRTMQIDNYVVGGSLRLRLRWLTRCIPASDWESRERRSRPDWVCFDWIQARDSSRCGARRPVSEEALDALKLLSFPKTSGSRGLHVFVPLVWDPRHEVLKFSQEVFARVAASHSNEVAVNIRLPLGAAALPRRFPKWLRADCRRSLLGTPQAGMLRFRLRSVVRFNLARPVHVQSRNFRRRLRTGIRGGIFKSPTLQNAWLDEELMITTPHARFLPSDGRKHMSLIKYRKKRIQNFTDSGRPKKRTLKSLRYVVQKHRASQLHTTFVSSSYGSCCPGQFPKAFARSVFKRLAMQVEVIR